MQSTTSLKYTLSVLLIIMACSVGTAQATVQTITGELKLMATIDGTPAFRPVIWTILFNQTNNKKLVKILRRHTETIELPPGQYRIVLSVDNVTHTRYVDIIESQQHDLEIMLMP